MYILGGRGRRFALLRVRDPNLSLALYIAELCVEDMAFSALFLAAETRKMMGTGGKPMLHILGGFGNSMETGLRAISLWA